MRILFLGVFAVHEVAAIRLPGNATGCDRTCLREAAGIRSSLSTLPHRHLAEWERDEFERDGVVVLRSVVTNRALLKQLEEQIWRVADANLPIGDPRRQKADSWNAAVRALVHDDLFVSIASSAVPDVAPSNLDYEEAPVWGFHGTSDGRAHRSPYGYHHDDPHLCSQEHKGLQVSLWLAVTDGEYPLEFVRGSHQLRKEVMSSACALWWLNRRGESPFSHATYQKECAVGLLQNATGNANLAWSTDMKAGDVFVFTGDILHMGVEQPTPRLAITLRYRTPGSSCWANRTWIPAGVVPTVED